MTKATFEIKNSKDYLNLFLLPIYQEYLNDSLDSRKALICSIAEWHFVDWIWSEYKDKICKKFKIQKNKDLFVKKLIEDCKDFDYIQQLATSIKHTNSDKNTIQISQKEDGFATGMMTITQSFLIIKSDNDTIFVINMIRNCFNCFERLYKDLF